MERIGCALRVVGGTVSFDVLVALTILQIMVLLSGVVQPSRILKRLPKQVDQSLCLNPEPPNSVVGPTSAGANSFLDIDASEATLEAPGYNDVGWSPAFFYHPEELLALQGGAFNPPEGIPQGLRITHPHPLKQEEIRKPNPYAWWDWGRRRDVCKRRRGLPWRRRNQEQVDPAWSGGSPVLFEEAKIGGIRYPPTVLTVSSVARPLSVCSFPAISPTPLVETEGADRPDFTIPFNADTMDLLEGWGASSSSSQDFGRPHHIMSCFDCRPCSDRVSIRVQPTALYHTARRAQTLFVGFPLVALPEKSDVEGAPLSTVVPSLAQDVRSTGLESLGVRDASFLPADCPASTTASAGFNFDLPRDPPPDGFCFGAGTKRCHPFGSFCFSATQCQGEIANQYVSDRESDDHPWVSEDGRARDKDGDGWTLKHGSWGFSITAAGHTPRFK